MPKHNESDPRAHTSDYRRPRTYRERAGLPDEEEEEEDEHDPRVA